MNTMKLWRAGLLMMAATLISVPSMSRPRHLHHHPVAVVKVVTPASTPSKYSQNERKMMAVNYLKRHKYLTIKKYAKRTGLSFSAAENELDAFARGRNNPVKLVMRKGQKVYTLA